MSPAKAETLAIHPLTPNRWDDFELLFGKNGACAGCWCMWWQMGQSEWVARKGDGTKRMMRARVKKGPPPGLLAYAGGEPVGWCAVAPRADIPRLARSKILAPVDDAPVLDLAAAAAGVRGAEIHGDGGEPNRFVRSGPAANWAMPRRSKACAARPHRFR
jgi:hypothetical protein